MKWMRERDALIAQTMAFVQSVTGKKQAAEPLPLVVSEPIPMPPPPTPVAPTSPAPAEVVTPTFALAVETPAIPSSPAPRPMVPTDFQHEIKSRVASFRAHQERFNREREEYFSATLAKLRSSIKDAPAPTADRPPSRKSP